MKNVKVVKNTAEIISDGFVNRFAPVAPSWKCFHNYALGTIVNMRKVLKYVIANYDNIKEKGALARDIGVKGATMKPISIWDRPWQVKDCFMFYYIKDVTHSEKTYANVENPDDIIVIRRKTEVKRYYPTKPLDYYKNFLRDLEYELKAKIEE